LLASRGHSFSLHSLNIVAVGRLQRGKDRDVTRLKLVRCARRETTQKNVVGEAKLQDLERLVRARSLVCGSNTDASHLKLIVKFVYPDSEDA